MGAGSLDCGGFFLNARFLLLMCKILFIHSFTEWHLQYLNIRSNVFFISSFFSLKYQSSLTGVGHLISEMGFTRASVGVHYTVRREV